MAQAKQMTISAEGLKKLKDELEQLKTVERKKIAEEIKEARSFGDLSENSEYDEAKDRQGKLEKRIADIEAMLANIRVVEEHEIKTDVVGIGAKVKILYTDDNEESEYTIVGPTEADPLEGRISDDSPVGSSLLGKKIGEQVTVEAPGGNITIKVLGISKQ